MKLIEVSEPALVFSPRDSVSKVAAGMHKSGRGEAVIAEGKKYVGTITARELVKRSIPNPDKTPVSGLKSAIRIMGPFSEDADVGEVINSVLINNYRSATVTKGGKFYTATKLSLLKLMPKNTMKGRRASDVMQFPYCIGASDSVDVARSIIRQMGVQRLVVIDDKDTAVGIVDTVDLLSAVSTKQRRTVGDISGDKRKRGGVPASSKSIIQSSVVRVAPDAKLEDVVKSMISSGNDTAIIEDKKFQGIITPVQVLKLLSKEAKGIMVTVSGLQDEDEFIKTVVDEQLSNEVRKLAKMIPIQYLVMHVDKYEEDGRRTKYSVKGRLMTQKGDFFAGDHAWDITKAVRGVLQKLEREISKKSEKSRQYQLGSRIPEKF